MNCLPKRGRLPWIGRLAALQLGAVVLLSGGQPPAAGADNPPWSADWSWRAVPLPASMPLVDSMAFVGDSLLLRSKAEAAGSEPQVLALEAATGRRRLGPTGLRDLVAGQLDWVRRTGTVAGAWTIDRAGRIWAGPSYFDGRRWQVLARSGAVGSAQLQYAWEALLDPDGLIWVPYRLERADCPDPGGCVEQGLRAFGPEGPRQRVLDLGAPSPGGGLGAMDLRLLQGPDGAWAFGPRWAYVLPGTDALDYPYLADPAPGALRHAGYASAAWWGAEGRPRAALWVELQEPEGVRELSLLVAGHAADRSWQSDSLEDCPLLQGAGARRITAGVEAEMDGIGTTWLGNNHGEVARKSGGGWWRWSSDDVGLGGSVIEEMALHPQGMVWAAGSGGLTRFGPPLEPAPTVYLPDLRP